MTVHDVSLWRTAVLTGATLGTIIGIPIGMWLNNLTRGRARVGCRLYDQDQETA